MPRLGIMELIIILVGVLSCFGGLSVVVVGIVITLLMGQQKH